ncbi:UNVERIFIED_CONTAM: DNA-directed RNA polymerase I subunit [Sesamum radiatum]|uniref:DNA-directed RNA polymerase n=1 Tax=Sesamum radiatum TaxID=300843 RepID=A0AAW2KAX8_SESRA
MSAMALSNSQLIFYRCQFDSYIQKLPEGLEEEARRFIQESGDMSLEKQKESGIKHLHKSRKARKKVTGKVQDNFIELVKQKYLSNLAPSGEPVGVIAAQSIGEPSTQMTLNTFHLAGRGEMNVTLGIPRLQEILMTASDVIKTPILTCPFLQWRSKHDVVSLVSNVKKVTVADLVESMEVQLSINQARIYKLKMKLKDTEFVSLEDIQETLKTAFLRELEDAIENHVIFLSRVSGIKNFMSSSRSEASNEADEDDSGPRAQEEIDDDDANDDYDKEMILVQMYKRESNKLRMRWIMTMNLMLTLVKTRGREKEKVMETILRILTPERTRKLMTWITRMMLLMWMKLWHKLNQVAKRAEPYQKELISQ